MTRMASASKNMQTSPPDESLVTYHSSCSATNNNDLFLAFLQESVGRHGGNGFSRAIKVNGGQSAAAKKKRNDLL